MLVSGIFCAGNAGEDARAHRGDEWRFRQPRPRAAAKAGRDQDPRQLVLTGVVAQKYALSFIFVKCS
mgnify:CR=1 FL=1